MKTKSSLAATLLALAMSVPAMAATPTYVSPGFINWQDWYPLDRGQAVNQRFVNPWSHGTNGSIVYTIGQSTLRVASGSAILPSTYGAQNVEYFINWMCDAPFANPNAPTASECALTPAVLPFFMGTYYEYMSQGTATNNAALLEHWIRGYMNGPYTEVHFNPASVGAACNASAIAAAAPVLTTPSKKAPLLMAMRDLPTTGGGYWEGPPVCTVVFNSNNFANTALSNLNANYTGLWFVSTKNLSVVTGSAGPELTAVNEYWVANSYFQTLHNAKCTNPATYDPYFCETVNSVPRVRQVVRNGVTYWIRNAEQYMMRKVVAGNRMTNGFASYKINPASANPIDVYDAPTGGTQVWYAP